MILPARSQFTNQSDHRIWTCATIARAIRQRGAELGLIAGDCYSDPPPVGCSLEFEHLVVAFAVGLHPSIVRHEKSLALRMIRSYLSTAKAVSEGDEDE
jgi:hypothetical protein